MRRRSNSIDDGPGQDSFLDIVANLVGILIILVIVVGVRAKDAIMEAEAAAAAADVEEDLDVATPTRAGQALIQGINDLQNRLAQGLLEVKYRQVERNKMMEMVSVAQHSLDEAKQKLDQNQRNSLDLSTRYDFAKRQLDDLETKKKAVALESAPVTELKHLPTPLAKTVFGKEIHFRMENHRIVMVPWQELVDMFKKEAPKNFWKLKEASSFTDVIGPMRGFRLKYTIVKKQYGVSASTGHVRQTMAELDHFTIIPSERNMGEEVSKALQPGSLFDAFLKSVKPERVTLTVWVYPDSYEDFRVLREQLVRRGFITAGRPLPAHRHIGGAPNGTRSVAQ